jgi:hypothetical protein
MPNKVIWNKITKERYKKWGQTRGNDRYSFDMK